MFRGVGRKLVDLFGGVVRFLVDEIVSASIQFLGEATLAAMRFVWKDAVLGGATASQVFGWADAPPEVAQQVNNAVDATPFPLNIFTLLGVAQSIPSTWASAGITGTLERAKQESLTRTLPALFPAIQAATLHRIGFMGTDELAATLQKQGFSGANADRFAELIKSYLDIEGYARAHRQGLIEWPTVLERAVRLGISEQDARTAFDLTRVFPPVQVILDALFRKIIDIPQAVELLSHMGYTDSDIDLMSKQARFYPPPTDLISWQAKEVYEPDSVAKYGLEEELELLEREPFYRGGLDDEQIRNYWVAHWDHPSWTQMLTLLHRRIVTEEEVWDWFRLVEVPPYWRQKMIDAAYIPLTRVDVRRMWDLEVVDDERLVQTYRDSGYRETDARDLLLFTKVERRLPDIISRYKNGWISGDAAYNELLALGIPAVVATRLWQNKIKNLNAPFRVNLERDLTKTEIIKGYKKELITGEQGVQMLVELGYDKAEAEFIILINTEFTESPDTPLGFQRGVEAYKKAQGLPYIEIPQTLIEMEQEIKAVKDALSVLDPSPSTLGERARLEARLAALVYRFDQNKKTLGLA